MKSYTLIAVILALIGCAPSNPPANPPKTVPAPAVQKKDDADHPLVKEARRETEKTLDDLIAGKYDDDPQFAPVARKVKGFRSWTIESQEVDPDLAKGVNFDVTLKGPMTQASFTVLMVKQQNGKWMIGSFSGPHPK